MSQLRLKIHAVLTGKAKPFRGEEGSAIAKSIVPGKVRIGRLGIEGDEQAELAHHGGVDKALHLYPQEHYPYWRDFLAGHHLLDQPGAFGENISSSGATEDDICLGDRFIFGTSLLEVSHGRKPCWKIDHRFERKGMTADIFRTGRTGLYLRVIAEGEASAEDELLLIERPLRAWPISRLFALLFGGGHAQDMAGVRALAHMPVLAEAWRSRAMRLME